MIEKKFGHLKNYKSLDNIRNSQVGHIQIDFRIACAIENFFHKACCPDQPNPVKIARRLRVRSTIAVNDLAPIARKKLNSAFMTPVNIQADADFPRLKIKMLKEKLALGSFQVKQAKSYIQDMINEAVCYELESSKLTPKFLKRNPEYQVVLETKSKLISVGLPSRHRRSTKQSIPQGKTTKNENFYIIYKVLVSYHPFVNNHRSITGEQISTL